MDNTVTVKLVYTSVSSTLCTLYTDTLLIQHQSNIVYKYFFDVLISHTYTHTIHICYIFT